MHLSANRGTAPTVTCDNDVNSSAIVDAFYESSVKLATCDSFYQTDDWARVWPTDLTDYKIPWLSTATSDGSGNFSSPVEITVVYPREVNCNKILITTGGEYFHITSVDIALKIKGSFQTILNGYNVGSNKIELYLQTPTPNSWGLTPVRDYLAFISEIKVTIHSIANPGKVQIYEIDAVTEKDISDDVSSWRVTKERDLSSTQVSPVGVSSANTASFSLVNDDNKYNNAYPYGPYYQMLNPNTRIDLDWGFRTNGSYEYVPQGRFFADSFTLSADTSMVEVSCRDQSYLLQDNKSPGLLYKDVLIQDIVRDIVERAGVTDYEIDASVLTNADLTPGHRGELVSIEQLVCVPLHMNIWSEVDSTYWEFLQDVAVADLGVFYFDEAGKFIFKVKESLTDWTLQGNQTVMMLSGEDHITSASYTTELVKNDFTMTYYLAEPSKHTTELWTAETTTLDAHHLSQSISATDVTINVETVEEQGETQADDLDDWHPEGYIKINNEIIKYGDRETTKFKKCKRGELGTTPAFHAADSVAYEVRKIEAQYDPAPATDIFYWITNGTYVDLMSIEIGPNEATMWLLNKYDGDVIVAGAPTDERLEGLEDYCEIVGRAIERSEEKKLERQNDPSIAKYGKRSFEISLDCVQSMVHARTLLEYLEAVYSQPVVFIDTDVFALPHLQLGDVVTVDWERLGFYDTQFHVVGVTIDMANNNINQSLRLRSRAGVI